jgi:hypothetical protein
VLGLDVQPHGAPALAATLGRPPENLLEAGHGPAAVVERVVGALAGDALGGAEGAQLGEGEVLGEPAGELLAVDGLGGEPVGELRVVGDVGGAGDVVLVAAHQVAVPGGHQVLLDDVGAHVEGELVGAQGVFWPVAGGAAVGDDGGNGQRRRSAARGGGGVGTRVRRGSAREQRGGSRARHRRTAQHGSPTGPRLSCHGCLLESSKERMIAPDGRDAGASVRGRAGEQPAKARRHRKGVRDAVNAA